MSPGRPTPRLGSRAVSALRLLALLVAGAFVCFCSLFVHRHEWVVGSVALPWGAVLCLATGYFGARGAGLSGGSPGAIAFGIGWLAILVATATGRPEGDYLIAADLRGYALMIGGLVLVALGVAVTLFGPAPSRRLRHRSTS